MRKNRLGVIGGLGPLATTYFIELLTAMTKADSDRDKVDVIVFDFPSIPDKSGYILGSNLRSPLPGLLAVGRSLARQGADYIAIPCTTAHFFYEELKAGIPAEILHGIRETAEYLKSSGITSAGIMATDGILASKLFIRELTNVGILPVLPSEERQEDVMHLIYHNVKAGKCVEMERFRTVEEELRAKGAEVIILGCTEMSLIKRDHALGPGFLDSMEILASSAILKCGGRLKEEYRSLIT